MERPARLFWFKANREPTTTLTPVSRVRFTSIIRRVRRAVPCLFPVSFLCAITIAIPLPARSQAQQRGVALTNIGQVHDLAPALAAGVRVHLVGTITYYDPSDGIMFLQGPTGGIYVDTDKTYPVHNGDLVEVNGVAAASYRTEVARNPEIHVIGRGPDFTTAQYGYRDLVAGRGDCKLVTVHGKVRAADVEQHENTTAPSVHLDVTMPDGEVQVYVHSSPGFNPESLLDATVEITAVAGGAFDAKYQLTGITLYAPDPSTIRILRAPAVTAQELPLTSINNVFQTRRTEDNSRRVRVRGTITYYKKGDSAVLEDEGRNSIYVQTRGTEELSIGDVVDAVGFASDHEYAPSLRQASILKTGARKEIVPRAVSYVEAASGLYSDNLISISGVLVSQLHDAASDTLVINADGHMVSGYLNQKASLGNLPLGSRVRIVGVCRIVPGGAWRAPYLSHIEMRSQADAQLISEPSWYSKRHLVELLSALLALALAIAVWAMLLKRRVIQQTEWINRSMLIARERSGILAKISANQPQHFVLSEICDSVMKLLPGTSCSYELDPEKGPSGKKTVRHMTFQADSLFEVALTGADDQTLGRMVVSAPRNQTLSADREEVYATLSEMATLAMRQSLLYQGLVHNSTHDPLTELPNRRLSEKTLGSALRDAVQRGSRLAVIYIDLNRFKHINDKYGHKVGDLYLRQISTRLLAQMRSADTLARVGGDEFLVIAPFTSSSDETDVLASRLQACFEEPFYLDGECIVGSASFGVARYPEHGTTADELTRNADHAMYISKHSKAHAQDELRSFSIITSDELEVALVRNQFRLAYQPQFAADGRMTGLEALIRLQDPILGLLTPDAFISVAERHPVIIEMGAWVLRRALQDAVRWKLHTGPAMVIAVNVSIRQLDQHGYAESVLDILKENAFPPERLELELIERSLTSGSDEAVQQLQRLRQAGVRISIDDFGTGQSCLSLLHRLPIDTIKLDRSFIQAMDDEPNVIPIIQAIVSMAHSLDKRVVAEAIEHVGPIPTLLKMGRMDFQGYLLSRPVPSEGVDGLIDGWRSGIVMPDPFQIENHLRRDDVLQNKFLPVISDNQISRAEQ